MIELDPAVRRGIENILGRPLAPDELVPAERLELLSEPVLNVARQLRRKQLALCAAYIHALAPHPGGFGFADFIDGLKQE
jgi:hypothetical protein